mmetsp:Transcript_1750/g.2438  ORF Transcript_1750/g.2438 Transcript_1750/m.2438 type:complete len:326 (+) Transcript_1750:183-1160(+)
MMNSGVLSFTRRGCQLIKARPFQIRVSAFSEESATGKDEDAPSVPTFPWRHSKAELQRVVDQDDLSGMPNNARARFVRRALAARELDKGWLDIFLTDAWKEELASDMQWAFQMGVAGMLSRTFKVPMDDINKNQGSIALNHTGKVDTSLTEEQSEETKEFSGRILEENLIKLYESVDPQSIDVVFKMTPVDCRLDHAFVIPLIYRELVRENPSFRGRYSKIEEEFNNTKDFAKVRELGEKLAEDTGFNGIRTIIVDVSVDCLETFQVRESSTGKLIQGPEEAMEKPVTHLVRFEITRHRKKPPEEQLGSWIIVDWDDLLDGNCWH